MFNLRTPRIFISYRSSDLALAKLVRGELASKLGRSKVYIDESIYGGNHIDSRLATELLNSTIFLPLLTDAYWGKLPRKIVTDAEEEIRFRIEEKDDFIGREFKWALEPKIALGDAAKDSTSSTKKKKQSFKSKITKIFGSEQIDLSPLSLLPMKLSRDERPDADPFNSTVGPYVQKLNSLRYVDVNLAHAKLISKEEVDNIKGMFAQTYKEQGRMGWVGLVWFKFERKLVAFFEYFRSLNFLFIPCSAIALLLGVYIWFSDESAKNSVIEQIQSANIDVDYLVKNVRSVQTSLDVMLKPYADSSQYQSISDRTMYLTATLAGKGSDVSESTNSNGLELKSAWIDTENINERIQNGLNYAVEISDEMKSCPVDTPVCVSGKTIDQLHAEYLSLLVEIESQITGDNPTWYCDLASAYTNSSGMGMTDSYLAAGSLFHKFFEDNADNTNASTAECYRQYLGYLPNASGRLSNETVAVDRELDNTQKLIVKKVLYDAEPENYAEIGIKTYRLFRGYDDELAKLKAVEVFLSTYDTIGTFLRDNHSERTQLQFKMLSNYSHFDKQDATLLPYIEQLRVKYRKGINDLARKDIGSSIDAYTAILGDFREIF
ncbi:MAG: toll/interleukin-1 receptor domain-containing protein [Acidiferrobacterales bacterium]|nr:toll/interleukin-1 receptor domain-containing protein [Acidiferrobacterales bacterium]